MSIERIYDYETALEEAFTALLTTAGLTAACSTTGVHFQSSRPRADVSFACGPAKSQHVVSGVLRHASFQGALSLEIITNTQAENRAYRAKCRNAIAEWRTIAMDCHKLQDVRDQNTSPEYKPDEGYFASRLIYAVDFGIDKGAWVELTL